MDLNMHSRKSSLECGCGGQLHVFGTVYGRYRLICDSCGRKVTEKYTRKRGYVMGFPKDVKRPAEVPEVQIMRKIEDFNGKDLMLKGTEIKPNEQYGDGTVLLCEREDGTEVQILTFSQVIKEQLVALADHLPLIIRPVNNGTYYIIY